MQAGSIQPAGNPVTTAINAWKDGLLDMRASNPLLDFDPAGDLVVPLVQPTAAQIIAGLTASGTARPMTLVNEAAPEADHKIVGALRGPVAAQAVGGVLREMRDLATDAFLAKGVTILYVTFGLLHWELRDLGARRTSPLLLLRVRLDRQPVFADYTLTAVEPVPRLELNPVLVNQLQSIWDVSLDDLSPPYSLNVVQERIRDQIADIDRVGTKVKWEVTDETFLGIFPLEESILYEDVERHQATIANHPVIRALATGMPLAQPTGAPARGDNPWQVVDADASQRKAIAAVGAGSSLVIEGPPGTGKSQTITNIIAQALGNDQTVLFVSEKMAALDVVARRLHDVGLGPYCLALHATTTVNDRAVLRELAEASGAAMPAAVASAATADAPARATRDLRLAELRRQIDGYFAALTCADNAWQRSAYDVIGEIATLHKAPRVSFKWDENALGALTPEHARTLRETIEALASLASIVTAPNDHLWHEFKTGDGAVNQSRSYALEESLDTFLAATRMLYDGQDALRARWGLGAGASLDGARWLMELLAHAGARGTRGVRRAWFDPATFAAARAAASHGAHGTDPFRDRRLSLLERFSPAVVDRAWLETFRVERQPGPLVVPGAQSGQWQPPARIAAGLALATLRELDQAGEAMTDLLGVRASATASDIDLLLELAALAAADRSPCHDWFLPALQAPLKALALDARQRAAAIRQKPELLAAYRPGILTLDADGEMLQRLDDDASVFDHLASLFRGDLKRLDRTRLSPGVTREEAAKALRAAQDIRGAEQWFATHAEELNRTFGPFYHGPETTDWDLVLQTLAIADRTRCLVNPNDPPAALVDESSPLTTDRKPLERLRRARSHAASAWQLYRDAVPEDQVPAGDAFTSTPIATLVSGLTAKLHGSNDLIPLCAHLAACRIADWTTFPDLADDMRTANELLAEETRLHDLFGEQYQQERTDWNRILDALEWVDAIQRVFPAPVPAAFADRALGNYVADARTDSHNLAQAIDAFTAARTGVLTFFIPGGVPGGFVAGLTDATDLGELDAWARQLRDNVPELHRWLRYQETIDQARRLELTPFLDAILAPGANIPARDWRDAFCLQLATLWLGWRQNNAPVLTSFTGDRAGAACAEFTRLDAEWQEDNARRLAEHLAARRADALAAGSLKPEITELRKASDAPSPPPLRQVLGAMPNLLPALKPCLLMSPAAVARYLGNRSATFNLVVFDEASQIMTADVIGAIARGWQTVVVGDSQQLPPTRFFKAAASDTTVSAPSLLDQCRQVDLPREWLLWHYRSEFEDLISYPNHAFYKDRLVTFPSPRQDIDPLDLVRVTGNYQPGKDKANNTAEAAEVVGRVIAYARAHPTETIGIITFSQPQQAAIQQELDRRCHADTELASLVAENGPHQLFVRNLERVQGDERDAIFFSVGYGPDEHGTLNTWFGPLNEAGGDRRLNVAITRAKKQVIIVCSFDPQRLLGNKNPNLQKLAEYLIFADQKPTVRAEQTAQVPEASARLQDAVARALEERGLHVIRNVGRGLFRIDIGVLENEDSGRCLLGIDCDGSVHQAAPDIRDRERLRPRVLERLGWTLHRVWSLDWLHQPETEIERIIALVKERRHEIGQRELREGTADDDGFTIVLAGGEPSPPTPPVSVAPSAPEPAAPAPVKPAQPARKPGAKRPATRVKHAGKAPVGTTLADLMRIPGIGPEFGSLLEAGGIASCRELRQRNPENLREALVALNAARGIARRVPSLAQLTGWIAAANALAGPAEKPS